MGEKLTINVPRVVHETIEGEVIVIDLATGTYFSLQGGAADVWTLIGAEHSPEEMENALAAAYGEGRESIRATLGSFLEELAAENLVVDSTEQNSVSQPTPALSGNGQFSPRLEKHTDMAELILLDPVHEVDSMGWPHRPPEDIQSAD